MTDDTEWEKPKKERTLSTISGREIGTNLDWDEQDTFAIILYAFEPNTAARAVGLVPCDLIVDWDNGNFYTVNDAGQEVWKIDMIEALSKLRRAPKSKEEA